MHCIVFIYHSQNWLYTWPHSGASQQEATRKWSCWQCQCQTVYIYIQWYMVHHYNYICNKAKAAIFTLLNARPVGCRPVLFRAYILTQLLYQLGQTRTRTHTHTHTHRHSPVLTVLVCVFATARTGYMHGPPLGGKPWSRRQQDCGIPVGSGNTSLISPAAWPSQLQDP